MAGMTHALDTDAQRFARATGKVKRGIRNGTLEGDFEDLLQVEVEKENFLNYFQYNKEERFKWLIQARSLLKVRLSSTTNIFRITSKHFILNIYNKSRMLRRRISLKRNKNEKRS